MIQFIYIASESTTSIGLNIDIDVFPDESKVLALYPNPIFSGDDPTLQVDISATVMPQIIIYNLLGAQVVNATIPPLDQGRHDISLVPIFSPQMASGVYLMDVILDDKIYTRKITLIK